MAAVFAITCLIGCGGGGSVEPTPAATPPPAATPDPTPAENIEVDVAAVTASAFQSPNVAENVIAQSSDNASRWSAQGRSDVRLQFDLGEKWSYKVEVIGREMVVTVVKEDGSFVVQNITWAAEYDRDWFYFRAGSYNQNNGGETDEFARVSFFALDVNHN